MLQVINAVPDNCKILFLHRWKIWIRWITLEICNAGSKCLKSFNDLFRGICAGTKERTFLFEELPQLLLFSIKIRVVFGKFCVKYIWRSHGSWRRSLAGTSLINTCSQSRCYNCKTKKQRNKLLVHFQNYFLLIYLFLCFMTNKLFGKGSSLFQLEQQFLIIIESKK